LANEATLKQLQASLEVEQAACQRLRSRVGELEDGPALFRDNGQCSQSQPLCPEAVGIDSITCTAISGVHASAAVEELQQQLHDAWELHHQLMLSVEGSIAVISHKMDDMQSLVTTRLNCVDSHFLDIDARLKMFQPMTPIAVQPLPGFDESVNAVSCVFPAPKLSAEHARNFADLKAPTTPAHEHAVDDALNFADLKASTWTDHQSSDVFLSTYLGRQRRRTCRCRATHQKEQRPQEMCPCQSVGVDWFNIFEGECLDGTTQTENE
jgi:hypothetical protein